MNIATLLIDEKTKYNKQRIASINGFIKKNGSNGSGIVSYKILNELKTQNY
ncbi:hypothetical protein [Spiroplasma endosymbiont of Dioctria linearis]|uniref:hypothetical protein n=1 Tax=Spiroplasma endosymbiont of Dioctria linearis TaxID=3066290 RepID=UPI00313E9552